MMIPRYFAVTVIGFRREPDNWGYRANSEIFKAVSGHEAKGRAFEAFKTKYRDFEVDAMTCLECRLPIIDGDDIKGPVEISDE